MQSSPSTGHSHHIRASSLNKQVLEAEIENNSVFLGHSSISHKHCNKYNPSRLRGFFWNCFTTSLTDTGYFITLSSESLQEFTPWAKQLLAAGVYLLLHCSLVHFKFLACVCFKPFQASGLKVNDTGYCCHSKMLAPHLPPVPRLKCSGKTDSHGTDVQPSGRHPMGVKTRTLRTTHLWFEFLKSSTFTLPCF